MIFGQNVITFRLWYVIYYIDDFCIVDTTMDFWNCSDVGMFSEKLHHESFTFSL